jgi:isochorismate hydrolase
MDYDITVISDCCGDTDEETHQVLMQKIFSQQTTVVTTQEFISLIENEPADKQ